jgi:hypothetical protein
VQNPVEGAFQTTDGRPVVGAPIAKPNGSLIVSRIDGSNHELDARIRAIPCHCPIEQLLRRGKTRVMPDEIGPAFSIGKDHGSHDAKSIAHRILVFSIARFAPIGDDSCNIKFARVDEEPHQRLLIVRVATGIRLDDHTRPHFLRQGARFDRDGRQNEQPNCRGKMHHRFAFDNL